jgi:rubrerythrin
MLRRALAGVTAHVAFATRRRTARQLFRFALAEHESMLELRAAAARSPSPERRALYLRHALDEQRHATVFSRHADEIRRALGLPEHGRPRTDCEALYERLGEAGFLAFVHRGEHRGRVQFEAYAAHFARRGDDRLRAVFAALITDEKEHERYTGELLVGCAGGEAAARALLRRVAFGEAVRVWRRAGQGIAAIVYAAAMAVLYACLLPFAVLVRFADPERGGRWRVR